MKRKYFVVATRWSDEEKAQVKYIAGEFDECINAELFAKAYNKFYSADATVEEFKY